jgi:hypothetical protein
VKHKGDLFNKSKCHYEHAACGTRANRCRLCPPSLRRTSELWPTRHAGYILRNTEYWCAQR